MKTLLLCVTLLFASQFSHAQIDEEPSPPPVPKKVIQPYEIFESAGFKGVSVNGEVKIKPIYKSIKSLRQKGYVSAKSEEGWFLFSTTGKMVSPTAYSEIKDVFRIASYFSNGKKCPSRYNDTPKTSTLFEVTQDGLIGVIDEKGKLLIPIEYDELSRYTAKKDGMWGAIDVNNDILIPFEYEDIGGFKMSNLAVAKKGGKQGVIDVNGNAIVPMNYEALDFFGNDYLKIKENSKWKLITYDGKQFLPGAYDKLIQRTTGLFQVEVNGKIGIFDKEGKELLRPEYENLSPYIDNHFIVQKGNRVGVYHPDNGWVIPFSYSEIYPCGMRNVPLLIAKKNGKNGVIDLKDNIILPFEYDHIDELENGFARVQKNGKWGFVELNLDGKSFKVAVDFIYDKLESYTVGLMEFEKNSERGYLVWAHRTRTIEVSKVLKPD